MRKGEKAGKNKNAQINIKTIKVYPKLSGSLGSVVPAVKMEDNKKKRKRKDQTLNISPSVPDLAIHVSACGIVDTEIIESGFEQELKNKGFPDPDVRAKCVANTLKIFVWLTSPRNHIHNIQRDLAIERLSIKHPRWTQTVFINKSTILRDVYKAWDESPKQFNHSGKPDSSGSTHLTGLTVEFNNNNELITRVKGYDESPWPDVSFELTITDKFGTSSGEILLESKSDLDMDTSILTGLSFIPLLGLIFVGQIVVISFADPDTPDELTSPGESIRQSFYSFANDIYLEGRKKLLLTYLEVETDEKLGIFASGYIHSVDREPTIVIIGLSDVFVEPNTESIYIRFKVITKDLRPNLRATWKINGTIKKTTSHSNKTFSTTLSFDCRKAKPLKPVYRSLSVRVVDADGLEATIQKEVRIYLKRGSTPGEEPVFDICEIRPWLPQCRTER
jgi:hypothetical protein